MVGRCQGLHYEFTNLTIGKMDMWTRINDENYVFTLIIEIQN